LLEAIDLHRTYRVGGGWFGGGSTVRAVDGVSLQIRAGESFGLVGESGCGKSTLGRLLLRLEKPTSGQVIFEGQDLSTLDAATLRRARRHMQMVFQDPYGSIDPRWTLGQIIGEPLRVHERLTPDVRAARVAALLADVGLEPAWQNRYPHQLSGGQRQRVAIARAIALRPRFILADEAFSALDASVQAQMVNLLQDLKDRLGLTYLFIGHGLHVVRHVSDRVGVMYLGRLVETGPVEAIFTRPAHPYTQALIAAIPRPGPGQRTAAATLEGDIPSAARLPSGCSFHTRCPAAQARCKTEAPGLTDIEPQRAVACHFPQT
jgi:oligopeptide/dipeptide ABC transporter ATP-binding protein